MEREITLMFLSLPFRFRQSLGSSQCCARMFRITANDSLLTSQLEAARGVFELEKPPVHSVLQLGDYLLTFRKAFNLVLECIAVAITIPVSSCSAERSFSAVKRIMTRLRTTMTNDRLSDLTVLSTHSALANNLNEDELVSRFMELEAPKRAIISCNGIARSDKF